MLKLKQRIIGLNQKIDLGMQMADIRAKLQPESQFP